MKPPRILGGHLKREIKLLTFANAYLTKITLMSMSKLVKICVL
jgi:hypothetical protein